MRELDVMLEKYLNCDDYFPDTSSIKIFEKFLEASDMDLYDWVTRRSRPSNAEFAQIVDRVLSL